MQSGKKITVVFFRTKWGKEPVREWLLERSKEDRMRIGEDIRVAEFGWPIGMPVCRALGGGLYEIRSALKDRIARVIFTISGSDMVLLHAFIKKAQSTPKGELELASTRLKQYRQRTKD